VSSIDMPLHYSGRVLKRLLDLTLAGLSMLLVLPLIAVLALLVRTTSPGGAIFRQVRVGSGGRPFVLYKLRTMRLDSDDQVHRQYVRQLLEDEQPAPGGPAGLYKLEGDPRVTRVGAVLRRYSLDELPQLVNVLRGDMSLVGPRPLLPWEVELLGGACGERFAVPPGITGLWQVSGRNRLTMRQALELDVQYVRTQNLRLDLAILLRTIPVLLTRDGA
jgi:lipopolysaccharide/colanic/teichoic acid biosynthesis glycosyltransferase